jgi:hypothetical protein
MNRFVRFQCLEIETSWPGCNRRDDIHGEIPVAVDATRVVRAWERAVRSHDEASGYTYVPATWLELDGSDEITTVRGTLSETLEKLDAGRR